MAWLPILRRSSGLTNLRDDMDRMFGSFLEDWSSLPLRKENGGWAPTVDIEENDKEYLVRAEVPGMDSKDVDISLKDDVLTIKGEKKEEHKEEEKNYHYFESRYGTFQRTFRLPQNVDSEKVKAECTKGVLRIHIPKVPETQPKKIEVKNA